VKAATLHRSDFVQQNATNTKTNKFDRIQPLVAHTTIKSRNQLVMNFFVRIVTA